MLTCQTILCLFLACSAGVNGNQTCNIFGNKLAQGNAPNGNEQSSNTYGLFLMTSTPTNCAGNATRWDLCFYSTTTHFPSIVQLGVYRPLQSSSTTYNLVSGSMANFSVSQSVNGFICSTIAMQRSQQFIVLPGDILSVCVQTMPQRNFRDTGRLGIIGAVEGLSVLQVSSSCSGLGSTVDTSMARTLNGYTPHIKLVINTCYFNNGGCAQTCTNISDGNNCSCYTGYQLDPNGQNCSVNSFSKSGSSKVSTLAILPTSTSSYAIAGAAITQAALTASISASTLFVSTTFITAEYSTEQETGPMAGSISAIVAAVVVLSALIGFVVLFRLKRSGNIWKKSDSPIAAENIVALDNMTYKMPEHNITTTHIMFFQELLAPDTIDHGCEDDKNGFCNNPNMSIMHCREYEIPKEGMYDYMFSNEESTAKEGQEEVFYPPASDECDLYIQLQNQRIRNIHVKDVQAGEQLGSGQFGAVYSGIWRRHNEQTEVAIKMLNSPSTQSNARVKFLQEAAIMAQFRHPNVIQLYGIVTEGMQLMIVIELAQGKDLGTHLQSLIPDPGELMSPDVPGQLLSYSQQIAQGMQYLARKQFVHRDVAARNILVAMKNKEALCKIADFGLSRELAEGKYYISRGGMIPVKWTAPEAIHYRKYSTSSDVWSYGCLLYEIWSVGRKPFEGTTNSEAIAKIESGYRLPPPPGCPLLVYQTMIQCWNPDLHGRPEFRDLCLSLSQYIDHVLNIPNEALLSHSQAGILGAALEAGKGMYIDLQRTYIV